MTKWLNSFTLFCDSHRKQVRVSHPEKTPSEITSMLATMWKLIPENEKLLYKIAAKKSREVRHLD